MTLTNLPKNKKAILLKRPENEITDDLFKIIDEECIEPNDDELLIRVDTIAIDAWIRTTFDEGSYHDTSQLNQGIGALGIGEVLISKSDKFKEGDFVSGPMGAQTHITMHSAAYQKVESNSADPELNIGLLGLTTGLTAYFGLIDVGKVKKEELVVVSGAAGGVGIIVCQLAKTKGAKVIGIAGGEEKSNFLLNEIKVDYAIDYKNQNVREELESIAKDKIDVFFDNVGGEILNDVLNNLNTGARIAICGAISQYNNFDNILGLFKTSKNKAYLHCDASLMPKNKKVWSSWNVFSDKEINKVSLTYWMNKLQNIDNNYPIFVTLNPLHLPDEDKIFDVIDYEHPIYDENAINGQLQLDNIQGYKNYLYCGAWTGNGFHEAGLSSSLMISEHLNGVIPWR